MPRYTISRSKLQRADHICTDSTGPYFHHGIYVGEAKVSNRYNKEEQREIHDAVISFYGSPGKRSTSSRSINTTNECQRCFHRCHFHGVVITCLDCFLEGGPLYLYGYVSWQPTPLSPDEVIRKAFFYLEEGDFGAYDYVTNNCEHFAHYCKTGKNFSNQSTVTSIIAGVTGVAAAAAFCSVS